MTNINSNPFIRKGNQSKNPFRHATGTFPNMTNNKKSTTENWQRRNQKGSKHHWHKTKTTVSRDSEGQGAVIGAIASILPFLL